MGKVQHGFTWWALAQCHSLLPCGPAAENECATLQLQHSLGHALRHYTAHGTSRVWLTLNLQWCTWGPNLGTSAVTPQASWRSLPSIQA